MSSKSSTEKETKAMAEVKEVEEAGKEETKSAEKETKTETSKKAAKEEAKPAEKASKKPASKKTAAKKTDKPELKPEVYVEYQGQQVGEVAVVEKVKAAFVNSGHRVSSIKSLQIYIKPEEFKAYYVINDGKYTGGVDLF